LLAIFSLLLSTSRSRNAKVNDVLMRGSRLTAYTSLAFGVVGIVACALTRDMEPKMDNRIEVYMENTDQADRNKFH
jgi:hypothetical protein